MSLAKISSTPLRFLGAGAALSLFLLTFLVFGHSTYSTNHEGSGYILKPTSGPTSNAQCECDSQSSTGNNTAQRGGIKWEFDFRRDGDNHGLSDEQCLSAFPKLFGDLDRVAQERVGSGKLITFDDVDELSRSGEDANGDRGLVRAAVVGGELYIISYGSMPYTFSRGKATLHSLNRALSAYAERQSLPNVEFVLSTDDFFTPRPGNQEAQGLPIWSYSKTTTDTTTWLMPDFGYWSWPEVRIGAYKEIRARIAAVDAETAFHSKKKQLAWRGSVATNPEIRGALLDAARGKSWASIRDIDWSDPSSVEENVLPMEEYCRYMFLAHAEGRSFSGRGKYLLNCKSVVISHELAWLEAHHGALIASGPEANYVQVSRDWSDLERKVEHLIDNPAVAERIAGNAVRTFRERYLTPAAESCYWRYLITKYAEASGFEPLLESIKGSGSGERVKRGVHFDTWALGLA
ncbi:glycosyl transferase family 90-domain-containing protein [Aspergillus granulosus]|uniref:Glycosyl transferase family 90-domain-containing protein n=1 Tax=Aspergillus granulosus TaxID=176169 RepID=A0ABR4HP92_9EURO